MYSLTGFFNIIILLGAVQGFVISALLYFSKGNRLPNRLLSLFIFLIALACFNLYLTTQYWYTSGRFCQWLAAIVPMVIIMPLGPLLFFYTKASLDPALKLTKIYKLHFYPVIIDVFPNLLVVIFIAGILTRIIKPHHTHLGIFIDTYNVYADIPRWISLSSYLLLSYKYLRGIEIQAERPAIGYQLKWLKQCVAVLMIFQLLWLAYLIPYVIPQYTDKLLDAVDWYPLYVPLAVIVYWLGIKGYLVMKYQQLNIKKNDFSNVPPAGVIEQTLALLKKAMEEDEIYLNPDLNLQLLAARTGVPAKTISAVINRRLNKSFNEFVNEYRIQAFKEKVQQPKMDNFTFAGIASECGFSSQATFQRSFKQITGLSPSEFKNQSLEID